MLGAISSKRINKPVYFVKKFLIEFIIFAYNLDYIVKTYIIKKLSEVDKSQLLDFYKKVYNNVDKSFVANIKWHYRIGYNSYEPIVIIVNNKIIGHAGLIPNDIKLQNKKYSVIWFVDFIILPEYRAKGYGKILTLEWMKICPHQITFCNNSSLSLFKKLNWKSDSSTNRIIHPINYFSITPLLKNFRLNLGNDLIRYLLKRKLKKTKLIIPVRISETLIRELIRIGQEVEKNKATLVRDESWFRWRLLETPYKKDIIFFEKNNQIIIGHVFKHKNIKRLNILYTNLKNEEKNIFETVVKWSIDNQIDFIWHVTSNTKSSNNLFSMFYKKKLNFAFNTSSSDLFRSLEGGLTNAQGIDSDIDYILRGR